MIQAVIFDLDGVLVFTDKYHYQAWKALADSLGIYFDETINNRLRGVSRMASLDIVLERYSGPALSAEQKVELANRKNEIYRSLLAQMTPDDVAPQVRTALDVLRANGCRLAIGSSSKNTPYILERTDLARYFDAVSDGNNITHSKPDPEVFLKAAGFLGVEPSACAVVEDAEAGVQAAHAAGMLAIAVGDASEKGCGDYCLGTNIRELVDVWQMVSKGPAQ